MKWVKKGLIYNHSATTPTPILLDKNTIRVYAGFRDSRGVSRIGYVDVDADNPGKIRRISKKPVLDIGVPGMFDDNGVILGDVLRVGKTVRMYYVGFQHVEKVKFFAFTGLAISRDNGETFARISNTPVFDRTPDETFIRAIHCVRRIGKVWRVWYGASNSWEYIGGRPYPRYAMYTTTSIDGITFPKTRALCIGTNNKEYRIGRPRVYKDATGYFMLYTIGKTDKSYIPGFARSKDAVHWRRMDNKVGIAPSRTGWDSHMLCYPTLLTHRNNTYMFYNGNGMGESGFGYAILASK